MPAAPFAGSSEYDKEYCRQKVVAFKKESDEYSDCLQRQADEKRRQDDQWAVDKANRAAKDADHKSERAKYWYGCRSGRDYC